MSKNKFRIVFGLPIIIAYTLVMALDGLSFEFKFAATAVICVYLLVGMYFVQQKDK
jgi:type IV secretory pathway VirB3-like protein